MDGVSSPDWTSVIVFHAAMAALWYGVGWVSTQAFAQSRAR